MTCNNCRNPFTPRNPRQYFCTRDECRKARRRAKHLRLREYDVAYAKEWRRKHRERYNQWLREYRREHPDKTGAKTAVAVALYHGVLKRQPCVRCGSPKVEAHHPKGYAERHWLTVTWLCRPHHLHAHGWNKSSTT